MQDRAQQPARDAGEEPAQPPRDADGGTRRGRGAAEGAQPSRDAAEEPAQPGNDAAEQPAFSSLPPSSALTYRAAPFYRPWLDPARYKGATPPPTSFEGVAGDVERQVLGASRLADRLQSRFRPIAFVYAVFKKYSDDEGGRLAAQLTYYTFLSLFPLAVLGFAIINTILADRPDLVLELVHDIVPPEYQEQVINAYTSLPDSGPAFAIALIGLLLTGTGGVFAFYAMVNQVFAVPYRFRFGFGPRYLRVLLVLVIGGIAILVVTVVSAFAANFSRFAAVQRIGVFVLVWLVASALLYFVVSVLNRTRLGFRELGLGAALGGMSMTVFLSLGSLLVGRSISSSSAIYGAFATVVGLFSVLFLVSEAIVFSLEISVVRAWELWPRGLDINLLFPADERAYALLTLMDERMPSQRNGVQFDATGHDDPRRPDPFSLQRRPPGIPLRPYDLQPTDAELAAAGRPDNPPADGTPPDQASPDPTPAAGTSTESGPAETDQRKGQTPAQDDPDSTGTERDPR